MLIAVFISVNTPLHLDFFAFDFPFLGDTCDFVYASFEKSPNFTSLASPDSYRLPGFCFFLMFLAIARTQYNTHQRY